MKRCTFRWICRKGCDKCNGIDPHKCHCTRKAGHGGKHHCRVGCVPSIDAAAEADQVGAPQ